MIDKIVALFATDDENNHDIAVELMKGQGISLVDIFEHTPAYVRVKDNDLEYRTAINPVYKTYLGVGEIIIGEYQLVIFRIMPPSIFKGGNEMKEGEYFRNTDEANYNLIRFIRENKHLLGI